MRACPSFPNIIIFLFLWTTQAGAQTSNLIAPGASLIKLAEGFTFTEGPAVDWVGNVYFTDQPNNQIYKWGIDQKLSIFLEPSGRANGLYLDRNGNLLACADERGELWQIAPSGQASVLVNSFAGKLLNGPNDLWVRPDNGVYFTDPYYPRNYWPINRTMEQDVQGVYFLSADRQNLTRVISDLVQPNGIIGTPDGKTLYVADIGANLTFAYDIEQNGALANKRFYCSLGSDGMTIDNEGNIYLTGQGVTIVDRFGNRIEQIPVPQEDWTGNVCFGGPDQHTLFITASRGLYSLRMQVRGVSQFPARISYRPQNRADIRIRP